jgi:hypothetical protein
MFRGAYDRYAAFEQFPQITYLINNWGAMGLVQASYNPNAQTKDRNMLEITTKALQATKEHFGDNHQASMQYFRNLIRGDNSTIPRIKPRTDLLETLLGKQATQILANKQLLNLSQEELSELSFNPWTLVEQTKGGHIPIANLPHLAVFADDRKAITTHLVEQILKTLSN